jgi:ABC-type maltose transport system permease subunit
LHEHGCVSPISSWPPFAGRPAGTLLSVLPVIVLFLLLQKEFVAGLTAGAVKG